MELTGPPTYAMSANRDRHRTLLLISGFAAAVAAVALAFRCSPTGVQITPGTVPVDHAPDAIESAASIEAPGQRAVVAPRAPELEQIRVFAVDEAGTELPDAHFLVLPGLAGAAQPDEQSLIRAVRSGLPDVAAHGSLGELLLPRSSQRRSVAWVLASCDGHEAEVRPVPDDATTARFLLRATVPVEVDILGLPSPAPEIAVTALPLEEVQDGRKVTRNLKLHREGTGYSIHSQRRSIARGGACTIDGLVAGSRYMVFFEDPARRFLFAAQEVEAPARITVNALEGPGVTLILSAPVPRSGAILWCPVDRKPSEARLSGSLMVEAGATTVFVPLPDPDREWFVDACGEAWSLASPVRTAARGTCTAIVADDARSRFLELGDGIEPMAITPLRLVRGENGVELEAISWDPMEIGPRAVHVKNGIVIRGPSSGSGMVLHWHDVLSVVPLESTQNRSVLVPPTTRELQADLSGQREAFASDLRSITTASVSWNLEQLVRSDGEELWYSVLRRDSEPSKLFADWASVRVAVVGEYRLRVTGTREWILPALR